MKKYLFIFISIVSSSVYGQITLLYEDFNSGFPAGWSLIDNDGLTPYDDPAVNFITDAWVMHEDYDSIGINDSILVATSWFTEPGGADDYLILPSLKLGSFGNYISFDLRSKDPSYPDGLYICFSTTKLDPWTFSHNDTNYQTEAPPSFWKNITVSLDSVLTSDSTGLANKDVILAFRHFGWDEYILELDNIKVFTNSTMGLNDIKTSNISLYPNPSHGDFFINGLTKLEPYKVFDISGKQVTTGTTTGKLQLELNPGVYFLQISNTTQKIILK